MNHFQSPAPVFNQNRKPLIMRSAILLGAYLALFSASGAFAALAIAPTSLPDWTISRTGYTQTLTTTGGAMPYVYTVTLGAVPTGMSLTSGVLSGTPSATGPFSFTVKSTDSATATTTQAYTITINAAPSITAATLAGWTVNTAGYNQTLGATGGTTPYTFTKTAGNLPPGIGLSTAGVLTGMPTTAATYMFDVKVTDAAGANDTKTYTIVVNPALSINSASLVPWTANASGYSQTIMATGGTTPYTFAEITATLPPGITLSAGGLLSGMPTTAGSYSFDVKVTDAAGANATKTYSILVNPSLSINAAALVPWTVNVTGYSQTITATGGTTPYTFTKTGTLPPGITLSAGGVLSGTPTSASSYTFTVQVADAGGGIDSKSYTIVINAALAITTTTLPNWTVNTAGYNQTIATSGGTTPFTFIQTTGTLPPGLTLSSGGVLSGMPTTAASYTFGVKVTDAVGAVATKSYTVLINSALTITTASLPNWTVSSTGYSQTVVATGGTLPYTYAVTTGSVPAGMNFSTAGLLNGTPSATGTSTFTVTATDGAGATATHNYSVTINSAVSITTAMLPQWTQGISGYSQTIAATGGTGTITFSKTGALPTGLSLAGTGVLSGTPSAAGSYTFMVTATDTTGSFDTKSYTVVINPPLNLSPTTLPNTVVSAAYNQTIMTTGGTGTVTYAISAITNTTGLNIAGGGTTAVTVAGAATSTGTVSFTVTPSDSTGDGTPVTYTFMVKASNNSNLSNLVPNTGTLSPVFNPATLNYTTDVPSTTTAVSVIPTQQQASASITVNGIAVSSGASSAPITLNPGVNVITIVVTAQDGATKSTYRLTVNIAPAITSVNTTTFKVGTVGNYSVTTTGSPVATLSETGPLPTGISFISSGPGMSIFTGTPATGAGGSYPLTVVATNGIMPDATQNFTLTVNEAPSFTSPANKTFTVGSAGNFTFTTGGFPKPTLSYTGALPNGVNLVGNVLSGTPAALTGGVYPISVTATNGVLPDATQIFTLTVNEAPSILSGNSTTFTVGVNSPFAITTSGYPKPTFTLTGTLPAGVAFNDNNDGTARLGAAPSVGSGGVYPLMIKASNGVGTAATQNFTLTINEAPGFTSASGTIFSTGVYGTFTITTSGNPASTITFTGTLPTGVTFTPGAGTATLSGVPGPGTGKIYPLIFTANNGGSSNATQNFQLTVNQAPLITSPASKSFNVESFGNFTVTTSGFPTPVFSSTGTLPSGVTLTDEGDGTAILSGSPAAGSVGNYPISITVSSSSGNMTQNFTLSVGLSATIIAADMANAPINSADESVPLSATVTTAPALMVPGTLNEGTVTFQVMNGAAVLGAPVTSSTITGGIATATYTLPGGTPLGKYTLVATYSGSANFQSSSDSSQVLSVNAPHPTITSPFTAQGVVGVPFVYQIVASNQPTKFNASALPPGLVFDPTTATIYGTPTTVGVTNSQISASNISGADPQTVVITVTPNQAPVLVDFSTQDNPALLNATATYSFNFSDVDTPFLSYTFNFGDGSPDLTGTFAQGTTVSLSHVYTAYGDAYPVSLTVTDGFTPVLTGVAQSVPAPASGADNIPNIGMGDPPVVSPLDGITVKIANSDAGVIQLGIDVESLTRDAFTISTDWGDISGRTSKVNGVRPVHQYANRGLFVAQTTATSATTKQVKGKARLTLAISSRETGDFMPGTQPAIVTANASNTDKTNISAGMNTETLLGRFNFKGVKKDLVSYVGTISLPAGLDMAKPHEFWLSIGNIVVKTTIDEHGRGDTPGTPGVLRSLRVHYFGKKGIVTVGGEKARVFATYYGAGFVAAGFDTEGISNTSTDTGTKIPAQRSIQIAALLDGSPFQTRATVNFEVAPGSDFGSISGRRRK